MVELLEGVHVELPVALDVGTVEVALGQLFERVVLHFGHHRPEEVAQRLLRLLGQVDEDEPRPDVAVHGHEAVVGLVQVEELLLLLDERAGAVEVVAPGVVLADELAGGAAGLLFRIVVPDQLVPAVPTHVVEGTDLAVLPLHHDDGRLGDGELLGEVAPGPRQLLDPAHVEPGPLEHGLTLELEELLGYGVLVVHRLCPELEVLRPAALGWLGPTWHEWVLSACRSLTW